MDLDLDQIVPGLYVGSCPIRTDDIDDLKLTLGVSAVLNLQTDEDFLFWDIDWPRLEAHYRESGIEVRRVPVRDFDPEDLREKLPACVAALDELVRSGHSVYVHCSAGVNRAPSTVIAYLHRAQGWEFDKAVSHVMNCRDCDPYLL
jgi:protein-tyrosine phosphatase